MSDDADTVFAIAAAMEAAVGHAKSRRDLASILWAATEAVGDDAPAAAAKLAAAADYVAGGGNLPSAGNAETFGGRANFMQVRF